MKTVVIIGSGFAGIYTAKKILKNAPKKKTKVIMISDLDYFLFTPLLHEVSTGGSSFQTVKQPIKKILKQKNFSFIKAKVKDIDTQNKKILMENKQQSYDVLVLATGSKTHFYNTKGAKEHALPLRTLEDALVIKKRILNQFDKALQTDDIDLQKKLLSFGIIGAGPTGIELAGELAEFIQILAVHSSNKQKSINLKNQISIALFERGPAILSKVSSSFRKRCVKKLDNLGIKIKTNFVVKEIGEDYVLKEGGQKEKLGSIFWAAGMVSNAVPLDKKEVPFYSVNDYFQVTGYENLFALGDCCHLEHEGTRVPMLAQLAVRQASVASHNVLVNLGFKKSLRKYHYQLAGFLMSIGQYYAVASIKDFYISGAPIWFLWKTHYLSKVLGLENKFQLALQWTKNLFRKRNF